jgi:TonB family protein
MQALLTFADTGGVHPAPAFAHRRQLFHRILSVSKEKAMSVPRIGLSIGVLIGAVSGASWYASSLFPIVVAAVETPAAVSVSSVQELAQPAAQIPATIRVAEAAVAAVQRTAAGNAQDAPHDVTPENPIPRRTRNVQPAWPSQFAGQRFSVMVNVLVRIARDGTVTNVFDKGCTAAQVPRIDTVCSAFFDAAAAAIRQWRYDRPVQAPLQFSVVLTFRPDADPAVAQSVAPEEWLRYVRETQDSLRVLAELTRGIAVVNPRDLNGARFALEQRVAQINSQLRELERAQRLVAEKLLPASELIRMQSDVAMLNAAVARVEAELRASGTNQSRALISPSGRAPMRVTPPVIAPTPIKTVRAQHSEDAMRARVEGTVTIEALVDEQGHVADARVIKSIPLLDQSALEAARQWEFKPALLDGKPVPVLVVLELNFTLRN